MCERNNNNNDNDNGNDRSLAPFGMKRTFSSRTKMKKTKTFFYRKEELEEEYKNKKYLCVCVNKNIR